jgi:predicted DNA-binding transcriptional regulator AlpA
MKLQGYITSKEFAKMCGVSVQTVRYWVMRGIGPKPVNLGVLFLFPLEEAQKFAQSYIPYRTAREYPTHWESM